MNKARLAIRAACDLVLVFAAFYARMLDRLLVDLGHYEAYSGDSLAVIVIGCLISCLGFASWYHTMRDFKCWWREHKE